MQNLMLKRTNLLLEVDRNNHHQVMGHFIKVCKGFACLFNEKLITRRVVESCLSTKGKALGIIVTLITLQVE